jgi:hypothetical protein
MNFSNIENTDASGKHVTLAGEPRFRDVGL